MTRDTLDIELRRRFIERTRHLRPRLPASLRRLGAVGPVLGALPVAAQPVIVKAVVTSSGSTGDHLRYPHSNGFSGKQMSLLC
jgi:hypothetical protein